MKDSLDRELQVGDQIVYCTRAGSSMNLIHARVLEVEEKRLRAQPLNSGRGTYFWVDTRTGEDIDHKDLDKHVLAESGYYNKITGEKVENNFYYRLRWDDPTRLGDYEYRSRLFADYVRDRRGPANPVYLRVSYYIAKLEPLSEQEKLEPVVDPG